MGKIVLPGGKEAFFSGDTGGVSDGYHTFDELYAHRIALFICLANNIEGAVVWKAKVDSEGKDIEGWFVAGVELPTGQITYHIPDNFWDKLNAEEREKGEWDGHTPQEVIKRLLEWGGKNE